MKDEYDFKDAVRGRYAARFREGPVTVHRLGSTEELRREMLRQHIADALVATQKTRAA